MKHDIQIDSLIQGELELLCRFNLDSRQTGIKIHRDAATAIINAAQRLYHKGLITQSDGGYLTDAGIEAAEHIQKAVALLQAQ